MQSIACDTVITANRPGPWPYHERYADKQVTPKARHNSHDEAPYEKKQRFFQTTQATTRLYTRLAWGAPLLSRRVLRVFFSFTLRNQIRRPETKQQTFGNFSMKTKPQSN